MWQSPNWVTMNENQFRVNRLDGGTEQTTTTTTTTTKPPTTTTTTTTTTAPTTTPKPSESDCGSYIEIHSNEKNSFDGLRYVHAGYKENNKDVFCYPRNRYNLKSKLHKLCE